MRASAWTENAGKSKIIAHSSDLYGTAEDKRIYDERMVPRPFPNGDPFAAALHFLRITGVFCCRSELTEPWGLFMPPMDGCIWFHAISEGRCSIEVGKGDTVEMGPGSFVLIPHGRGHRLRSSRRVATPNVIELPQEAVSERYSILRHGGGGAAGTLICGVVRLEPPAGPELEGMLPTSLHLDTSHDRHGESIASTLRMMGAEARVLRPGGEAVVTRLADILVIQCLRVWLETDPAAKTGWLGALRDPQLGNSVSALWQEPSKPWSVALLAKRAAMSRSTFVARFTERVGEPPMRYLARVRMQVASAALRNEAATVGELSWRLGYRSEAAFNRAFKRIIGQSPGALRRQSRR